MQISKKNQPTPKQQQVVHRKAHPQAIIPYGRHQGSTVAEVMQEDSKYWLWVQKEGLIDKWLLYLPPTEVVHKPQALQVGTERWISLYEVKEPGSAWEQIEDWVIQQVKSM